MKLRTKLVVFGAALSLTAMMVAATAIAPMVRDNLASGTEVAEQETPEPTIPPRQRESGYWVCAPEDLVLVFDGEDRALLLETTRIELRALRAADQILLRDGVWVADRETLLLFLEDFGP